MASASANKVSSFVGNLSDRFNPDSLKCLVCLDELTEQRGLVEFPCCNNIFACLCCFMELVVVNQTTIAPCCRRPLNFVRSISSEMRRQIERERQEAQRQLELTQYERNRAAQELTRIQTENRRFQAEQQDITYKLTILRNKQEEQERLAKEELERRLQRERQELIRLEQLRLEATSREQSARLQAEQYKEVQKRRHDIERKIKDYVAEINKPKFPTSHYGQVYQNLQKLLTKYPDFEEFILTTFAEIRRIRELQTIIAADLKSRQSEIVGSPALQSIVRLQIMALNSLEFADPVCNTYYQNYLYLLDTPPVPEELISQAARLLGHPITISLDAGQFSVSYKQDFGFSFSKCAPGSTKLTQLPTNVELHAKLTNVFAMCEVENTNTTAFSAVKYFAAFTLDSSTKQITINLMDYELYELFGAEDVFITKRGTAAMSLNSPFTSSADPFKVNKFSIEKCGQDLFNPTIPTMKTCVRFE